MRPSSRRRLRRWFWIGIAGLLVFVILCNRWIINSTGAYLYTDASLLPSNEVGLVLGTSPYTEDGEGSLHFKGRLHAAAQLYQMGKVKHLIVSGANPDSTYNEPRKMWQALVKAGVPQKDITMDFAGVRTLDSVVRAQAVWGQSRFTVITQRYHAYRAVFLARKLGMNVAAYVAPMGEVDGVYGARNPPREIFARAKAVLDLLILNTQPKFLGQPQNIEINPASDNP